MAPFKDAASYGLSHVIQIEGYTMRDPLFPMALVLGLLATVGPFAIDMYLSALPRVAEDIGTTDTVVALTLAIYLLTF